MNWVGGGKDVVSRPEGEGKGRRAEGGRRQVEGEGMSCDVASGDIWVSMIYGKEMGDGTDAIGGGYPSAFLNFGNLLEPGYTAA